MVITYFDQLNLIPRSMNVASKCQTIDRSLRFLGLRELLGKRSIVFDSRLVLTHKHQAASLHVVE